MDAAISQLRKLPWKFRKGASRSEIDRLEKTVGYPLTPELAALYINYDGVDPTRNLEYRLMPVEEAIEAQSIFLETELPDVLDIIGGRFFWSNDNSDYGGLCLKEPFRGLVFFMEHDGEPFYFSHRSIQRLYEDILRVYQADLREDLTDEAWSTGGITGLLKRLKCVFSGYPVPPDPVNEELGRWFIEDSPGQLRHPHDSTELLGAKSKGQAWRINSHPREDDDSMISLRDQSLDFAEQGLAPRESDSLDGERARILEQAMANAPDRVRPYLFRLFCGVLPRAESNRLVGYLNDDDFYVGATAADSLRARRWKEALPQIEGALHSTVSNARTAAQRAFEVLRDDPGLDALLEEARQQDFESGYGCAFYDALTNAGGQVIVRSTAERRLEIRYRMPDSNHWEVLWKWDEEMD